MRTEEEADRGIRTGWDRGYHPRTKVGDDKVMAVDDSHIEVGRERPVIVEKNHCKEAENSKKIFFSKSRATDSMEISTDSLVKVLLDGVPPTRCGGGKSAAM